MSQRSDKTAGHSTPTQSTWGGRFEEQLNAVAARVNTSVDVDKRLGEDDVRGSIAHIRMLAKTGIVSADDAQKIESGLRQIGEEIAAGSMEWKASREDVHMNIEATLSERIGAPGGKLHTGAAATTRWPPTCASSRARRARPRGPHRPLPGRAGSCAPAAPWTC
jgi:hypothetical protein